MGKRIELLRVAVGQLKALVDEPEPGLSTWMEFVAHWRNEINAIMDGGRD
jgi:hypothetical protein